MAAEDNQPSPVSRGNIASGLTSPPPPSPPQSTHVQQSQYNAPPASTFFGGEGRPSVGGQGAATASATAAKTFKISQAHLPQQPSKGAGGLSTTASGHPIITHSNPHYNPNPHPNPNPNPNPTAWFTSDAGAGIATGSAGDFFGSLSTADVATPEAPVAAEYEGLDDRLSTVSASLSTLDFGAANACPRCRRPTEAGAHFCNRCGYQLGSLDAPSAGDDVNEAMDASPIPTGVPSAFEAYSGEGSFVDTRFGDAAPTSSAPTTFVLNETPPRHLFNQTMDSLGYEVGEGEAAATMPSNLQHETIDSAQGQGAPPSHGIREGIVDSYYYYNMGMSQSSAQPSAILGGQVQVQPMASSAIPPASLTQATVPLSHHAPSSSYAGGMGGGGGGGGGVPLMRSGTIDSFASSTAIHMMNRSVTTGTTMAGGSGPLTSFALPSSSRSTAPVPGTLATSSARSRIPLIQSFRPDINATAAGAVVAEPTALPSSTTTNLSTLNVGTSSAAAAAATTTASLPSKPTRVHPVFCFGFGGLAFVTFPIKQMRFTMTPTGVPASSPSSPGTSVAYHRPGPLHRVSLSGLPRVQELCIQPVLQCAAGQPLMDQRHVKVKELVAALETLLPARTTDPQGRDALIRLLHLMLTNKEGMGMGEARDETVRRLLLPDEQRLSLESISSISSPASQQPSSMNGPSPGAHAELVKLLLRGDRGNAVMLAVSQHMWPHALLIASHVDRETYCATVGEFARQVLPLGHPLRMMYLLFAEQHALAGAEMQSMASPALRRDWLIQLAMIMSNRTPDDHLTIMALGDALRQEGLIHAAHLCYLLCDDANLIAGPEADSARIVYLGADHERAPHSFLRNWSALRLTEILEFALRQASGGHYVMGHLQAYKLKFAGWLADLGLVSLAMQYCQVVEEAARLAAATNKSSPASSYLRDPALGVAAKSLYERLARHLGAATAAEMGSATISGSGWLPKMGGILEAFDRGLTRVIGVSTEEGGKGSGLTSADGTINVMAAIEQEPSGQGIESASQIIPPPPPPSDSHSQTHLVARGGEAAAAEAWSHVSHSQPPPDQSWQSFAAPSSSYQGGEDGSSSLAPAEEGGYNVHGSFQDQQYQYQHQQSSYNQVRVPPTASGGPSSEPVPGPREQVGVWQHPEHASVPTQASAVSQPPSTLDPASVPSFYAYDPQQQQQRQQPMARPQPQQPSQVPSHLQSGQSHQSSMSQYHQAQAQAQVPETLPFQTSFSQPLQASSAPTQFHGQSTSPQIPLSSAQPLSSPPMPAPPRSQPPAVPMPSSTMPRPPSHSPSLGSYSQGSAGQWTASASGPTAVAPPMDPAQGDGERAREEDEDEDDLGFGNLSLSKGAKSVDGGKSDKASSAAGGETGTSAAPSSTAGATAGEKKGVLGFITGWFGRKGATDQNVSGPKQASLGEPSSFRYDEKLKRWVDDKDPSTFEPIAPPPLPLAKMKTATAVSSTLPLGEGGSATTPGLNIPSGPAVTASPNDFRRGTSRSARSRYVDPFNPQAGSTADLGTAEATVAAAVAPIIPTPMIPLPSQHPMMTLEQSPQSQSQIPMQQQLQQHPSGMISPTQDQVPLQQQTQWQGDPSSMHQRPDQSQLTSFHPHYQQPHPTSDQSWNYNSPQYYHAAPLPHQQQQQEPPPQEYQPLQQLPQQQQPLYYYQDDPNAPPYPPQPQQYTYSQ